ncbi:dipeptidase 1-like isoform X2 [Leptidea sinapis]|uniref:dipeptidase 1-like isoform X2 n=1 Tax=Leptidea sinapis TaxID=189913 RepID=UPI0021C48B6E|nr:dipeptidase 1-like isoform X2 [Leptidea sinapis]
MPSILQLRKHQPDRLQREGPKINKLKPKMAMVRGHERRTLAILLLTITAVVAAASYDRERLEIAKQILEEVPLTDGHNDLPWNIRKFLGNQINEFELDTDLTQIEPWSKSKYSHTDLPRLREGMVGAQFWSAFVPCGTQNKDAVQLTLEQIDIIKRLVDKYPKYLKIAKSVKDILETHSARPRKVASLIGIEGGHSIGNSLGVLRTYYQLGVRYMTLTHTCNTPWADSSNESPSANGLTEFGEKVVREMNRLGMIIDLSHVGVNTSRAAIRTSRAPVIFSHSSAYSLCPHKRNVPDDILQSLKENGGVIMVNFFPDFVKCAPNATLSDVAEHFHYIKRMIGADHVGIGGDFDGVNRVPRGLEDVSRYPQLFAELLRSGQWTVQELKNVAGLNLLRVMGQVEKVRDEMRTNGVEPEEHDDTPNDGGDCVSNAFYTDLY